jgi:hypothetical protein
VQVLHVGEALEERPLGVAKIEAERGKAPHDGIKHDAVLAQVLFALEELATERGILARSRSTVGRAREGLGRHDAVLDPKEPLGARADEALAGSVRHRECAALGEALAQAVQYPQRVECRAGSDVLRAGKDDLLHLPARDPLEGLADSRLVAPAAADLVDRGGIRGLALRERRGAVVERPELGVRVPDAGRQGLDLRLDVQEKVRHGDRAAGALRDLPARDEDGGGLKRLAVPHVVEEREGAEEMGASKRDLLVAHGDRVRERAVDEALALLEALRARG